MKHCDPGIGDVRSRLSPLARPFTFGSSSSSSARPRSSGLFSIAPSESETEDSIWGDYAIDFSFLISDDQRSGGLDDDSLSYLSRDADAATVLLKEGSELFGKAAYASVKDERITLETMRQDNFESFLGLSNFLEPDLRSADSQLQVSPSVPVISTNQSNSIVNLEGGCATHFPSTSILGYTGPTAAVNGVLVANANSGDGCAEEQLLRAKGNTAHVGKVLLNKSIGENNPSSFFSNASELRIKCSISADNDKLDLYSASATGMPEKSSVLSDQDDSEVDSPCWRGTQSYNTLTSGSKAMSSRHSSDDLNRFYGLNPLAPHFIPACAKKSLDKHAKEYEESSTSSLKKSLSSTFPLSSGDYCLTDTPNKAVKQQSSSRTDRATFLTHNTYESFGFVSQDSVSNTVSILDSRNEFQTSKKLDPSAPVFVPASATSSAAVHEKQAKVDHKLVFETNAHTNAALSSLNNRLKNNLELERSPAEVGSSFGNQYYNGAHEPGTSGSFNPWLGSEVGISENTSLNDKLNGRHRDRNVIDTALAKSKSSVYMESYSSGIEDSTDPSSSNMKAFSDLSPRYGCPPSSSSSPEMDVKELLTTMHGLSELLTLQSHSCGSDLPNEQEIILVNCIVQNLNLYMRNRAEGHAGDSSNGQRGSYDLKRFASLHKLSIRDIQPPGANKMTVNLDPKRKEKYSAVSNEIVPHPCLSKNCVTRGNGSSPCDDVQVVSSSAFQQNHPPEELINPQVSFYRSLWLKAEANRCLIEYEASLSRMKF